jgi:hypothetical protein
VGKKKDKDKAKAKATDNGRLGRKDLTREVERLQSQIEALRARLDRIAEIAGSDLPETAAESSTAIVETQDV